MSDFIKLKKVDESRPANLLANRGMTANEPQAPWRGR
jgi:hypothetical protein